MSVRDEMLTAQIRPLSQVVGTQSENTLLASLPAEDYIRIAGHLIAVPMRAKDRLCKQDAPIEGVYFPGGGACALVKTTEEGHTAQIAVVGAEGAIGVSVFFGLHRHPCDVIVHVAGPGAEILPLRAFSDEMEQRGALYNRIIRYNQALVMQLMQSTACNGLHSATERFAYWLLSTHDRAGLDAFPFTHDFAAMMLGLRRPTVTLIAGGLQAGGIIEYRRGTVRIIDRAGLEAVSCGCYREASITFGRLLPEVRAAASH